MFECKQASWESRGSLACEQAGNQGLVWHVSKLGIKGYSLACKQAGNQGLVWHVSKLGIKD